MLPPPCVCCLVTVCKNGCHVKTILGFIHYALYYQGSFYLWASSSVMQRDHIRGIFQSSVPEMDGCINCKVRAFVFLYKRSKTFFPEWRSAPCEGSLLDALVFPEPSERKLLAAFSFSVLWTSGRARVTCCCQWTAFFAQGGRVD